MSIKKIYLAVKPPKKIMTRVYIHSNTITNMYCTELVSENYKIMEKKNMWKYLRLVVYSM